MRRGESDEGSTLVDPSEDAANEENRGDDPWIRVLVVIWSRDEPERVGELIIVPRHARGATFSIGRARSAGEDGAVPLGLVRLRPFELQERGPLEAARVSRRHLRVRVVGGALEIHHPGRGRLAVNGAQVESATVKEGDVVESVGRFMLLVSRRPATWSRQEARSAAFNFGEADPSGIVGESEAAWALRRQIEFVAKHSAPLLVHGASGSGKESVVQAIHRASSVGERPLVARNAATLPEGLIDAELFGNLKNYPNPGMPERPGLLGEADASSLFLDEIGELPQAMQAHLLRVMDSGEYQRLGEALPRVTRARLIGATNRELGELKHDLLARFALRIHVSGLDERRDDIMLIARHLLRSFAAEDPAIRDAFFVGDEPRFAAPLARWLVMASYSTHVRELTEILWRSIAESPGASLQLPTGEGRPESSSGAGERVAVDAKSLTKEQILEALERCDGVRERAWRALGLRSRHQLKRLLKHHEIR